MRITTNAILRGYQSQLSNSITNLNTARTHVMTQRSFNSAAEDPASAFRAAQLERKYYKNSDHLSMLKDIQSQQLVQEESLMQVNKAVVQISENYSVQVLNGTNGPDERKTFASAIREYQKSMVLSMNATFEDNFVFAGADGKNPPFELSPDGKTLTYRNINVDTSNATDLDALDKMSQETQYVDLGFGLSHDANGAVVSSSAFNMAMPGITALGGYGVDSEGMSNNAISLAGQLAEELEKDDFDIDNYEKLMTKFKDIQGQVLNKTTELGVKSEFLTTTENNLKDRDIAIQEQLQSVAGVDMAEAISNYSWAQYAYNAALKVGTSILSPSFIDFMK